MGGIAQNRALIGKLPLITIVGRDIMNDIIAFTSVFGQRPGEESFEIKIEIGTPYRCGDDPEEWACPVAVRPLHKNLRDAHGSDSFQSLCLAISLAQNLLQDFREKGGSLTHENGELFPLESYSFGIAKWY
ncbi:MAG: hypothetical protein PVG41_09395 [Desulfobacteraceae bacterium]|jgi:hypothetical protein